MFAATAPDGGSDTRTVVASLVVGVFFGGMVGGVAFPTLPRLGSVLGFSALIVGVILAINRATRMVVNVPLARSSIATAYGYPAEYLGCALLCAVAIGVVVVAVSDDATVVTGAIPADD